MTIIQRTSSKISLEMKSEGHYKKAANNYRKSKQLEYNKVHKITPQSVKRNIGEIIESIYEKDSYTVSLSKDEDLSPSKFEKHIQKLEKKYDSALSNSGPIEDQLLLKDLEKFFETNKGNENGPKE